MASSPSARLSDFAIGQLFATVSEAVIVGDLETDSIVLWNPAAEKLFGYAATAIIGQPLSIIVADRLRAQHQAAVERFRRYGRGRIVDGARPVEVVARASDGREFPIELTLSRIDTAPAHLLAIVRDISDRKEVRLVREAEQQRREFFAMASHELKSPLTAVSNYVQLAERQVRRGQHDHAAGLLASARDRIDQMARLVDELLEVSRLEVGGFVLRRARIDLRETLHRVLAHYAADASDRLRALPGSAPVLVEADAQRIEEVIDNLVTNALKYGRDEPVDIELMTSEGIAVLRVRDRGIGIPAPDRSQLFTAFFRTSNSVNIGGTGLGLFISRRIAELHGGRLSLSETGAEGSVFTLELPLAE